MISPVLRCVGKKAMRPKSFLQVFHCWTRPSTKAFKWQVSDTGLGNVILSIWDPLSPGSLKVFLRSMVYQAYNVIRLVNGYQASTCGDQEIKIRNCVQVKLRCVLFNSKGMLNFRQRELSFSTDDPWQHSERKFSILWYLALYSLNCFCICIVQCPCSSVFARCLGVNL